MMLIVNGRVTAGTTSMWRIDDMDNDKSGLQFVQEPFALVYEREHAELICKLVNQHGK